jgi:hypothetical protein
MRAAVAATNARRGKDAFVALDEGERSYCLSLLLLRSVFDAYCVQVCGAVAREG